MLNFETTYIIFKLKSISSPWDNILEPHRLENFAGMVWGNCSSTQKCFIRIISKLSNDKTYIPFWQGKKWLYLSLDSPPLLSHPLRGSVLIPKLHYLLLCTVIITFLGKNPWSLQKWFWLHNRRVFFEEGESIKK